MRTTNSAAPCHHFLRGDSFLFRPTKRSMYGINNSQRIGQNVTQARNNFRKIFQSKKQHSLDRYRKNIRLYSGYLSCSTPQNLFLSNYNPIKHTSSFAFLFLFLCIADLHFFQPLFLFVKGLESTLAGCAEQRALPSELGISLR